MANLVKTKQWGILGALVLLTISLFIHRTKNDIPERYKQWTPDSTLYTHDFLKAVPWIGREYDATITASMKVIWADSVPKAIVQIDRMRSWYDKKNPPEVLTHETYHANLYSVFAEQLNRKIAEDGLSAGPAYLLLSDYFDEAMKMQALYDAETKHGLLPAHQHYWEYKIDSMYNYGRFSDHLDVFTGAYSYFPSKPEMSVVQDTFVLKKLFSLSKYGMSFQMEISYDNYRDSLELQKTYADFFESKKFKVAKFQAYSKETGFVLNAEVLDTVNDWVNCYKSVIDGPHEYLLTVAYPGDGRDSYLYNRMKQSFFKSFRISDTRDFWLSRLEKQDSVNKSFRGSLETGEDAPESKKAFTTLGASDNSLFYHHPFIHEDQIIILFEAVRHSIGDLKEVLLKVNDTISFSQSPDGTYQMISIPLKEFSKGRNKLQFGYIAKSDSTRSAYHLYSSLAFFYRE